MENCIEVLTPQPLIKGEVLLLIDHDNTFYGLLEYFDGVVEKVDLEKAIKGLVDWVQKEVGELIGGYGFVFAPEHLSLYYQEIYVKCGIKLRICPKKIKRNSKGEADGEEDTVDANIIEFAEMMVGHPNFKTICLASADMDYVPLFEKIGQCGITRALALPSKKSMARDKRLLNLADINPATGRPRLLMLNEIVAV